MNEKRLTIRPYTVVLGVTNLERACLFYRDKLGLTCQYHDHRLRFAALVEPGSGTQRMTLHERKLGEPHLPSQFWGPCPVFMSDDIEGDRTELERRGVPVGPVIDLEGAYAFSITDPDGNECAVAQLMPD